MDVFCVSDTVKAVVCFEMLAINIRDRPPEEVPRFLIFDSTVERLIDLS